MRLKMMIRCYSDLKNIETFKERYLYLKLNGVVGQSTFGFDRQLNQMLYSSRRWKRARDIVITRDRGCDLGVEGYDIHIHILIHHMNPITIVDIEEDNDDIYDPEFLICTTKNTHNAIHFGDESILPKPIIVRRQNDTCPWLK